MEYSFDLVKELGESLRRLWKPLCDSKEEMEDIAREYFVRYEKLLLHRPFLDYYVVLEGALKLKEISYIQAKALLAESLNMERLP